MENTFLTATESAQKEELDKIANHLREIALPFFQSWINGIPRQRVSISSNDISCRWVSYAKSVHFTLSCERIISSRRFVLCRTLIVTRSKINNSTFSDLSKVIETNMFIKSNEHFPYLNFSNAKSSSCDIGKYVDSIIRYHLDENVISPNQPSCKANQQSQNKVCIEVEKRLPEINEICMDIIKKHYKDAGTPFVRKKGFIVGTPLCCNTKMEYSGYVFAVSVNMSVQYDTIYSVSASSRKYSLDKSLFGTFEEACENVYKVVLTMAKKHVQKLLASSIVCQINKPDLMERLKKLNELKQGYGQCIRIVFPELSNIKAGFLGCNDSETIIFADSPLSPAHCFSFSSKSIKTSSEKPFQLGRYKQLPDSPFELARFAKKASDLYSTREPQTIYPLPTLTFSVCNNEWRCLFEDKSIDIVDKRYPDDTLKDHLNRLFEQIDEFCAEKERYVELQIKALNRLNPTEFAIMEHISARMTGDWDSGTWLTKVNECLGNRLLTSKTATEHFLCRLCNIYIEHNNKKLPLATFNWVKADHCEFKKYTTNIAWSPRAFMKASPRPFNKNEFAYVKADKKTGLFEQMVDSAKTEEDRWAAISILEEQLPKKYAIDFVKSDRGRNFFRSLTEEDATYARFFIESLPGCKKLASEIFE